MRCLFCVGSSAERGWIQGTEDDGILPDGSPDTEHWISAGADGAYDGGGYGGGEGAASGNDDHTCLLLLLYLYLLL